jgi:ribose 5-phosphate isomerase B
MILKIFIGADHNGLRLKEKLEYYLTSQKYEVVDMGGQAFDPRDDFPVFAARVSTNVLQSPNHRGILICASGQGMAIAANRFKGIRAGLCTDFLQAREARNDDDINVLVLPANILEHHLSKAEAIINTFLRTPFDGDARFVRRLQMLDTMN